MKLIFTDLHHFDLYHSFHLLFNKRSSGYLYRPIGLDWYTQGYWKIHDHPLIIQGYLGNDVSNELSKWKTLEGQESWARHALEILRVGKSQEITKGIYIVYDKSKDIYQSCITLERFMNVKFDIVISSIPAHFPIYEELIAKYQPKAKHIFQAGNKWDIPDGCKNLMYSSLPIQDISKIHSVQYHQEFDLSIFKFNPIGNTNNIFSYIHYPESEQLANETLRDSSLNFKFIGKTLGLIQDIIISTQELANTISNSMFTWHIKPSGDGYGHILYNSFACGTPVITNMKDYEGCCGLELLEDGVTCIDTNNKTPTEIRNIILSYKENNKTYLQLRKNVYHRFKQYVNFDKEYITLKTFMENLV